MSFISWIKSLFNKLVGVFKEFIEAAIPLIYQIAIAQLKPFAVTVVERLTYENIANSEKRKIAMNEIKIEAVTKLGRELPEHILRIIVEIALGYKKNLK